VVGGSLYPWVAQESEPRDVDPIVCRVKIHQRVCWSSVVLLSSLHFFLTSYFLVGRASFLGLLFSQNGDSCSAYGMQRCGEDFTIAK